MKNILWINKDTCIDTTKIRKICFKDKPDNDVYVVWDIGDFSCFKRDSEEALALKKYYNYGTEEI